MKNKPGPKADAPPITTEYKVKLRQAKKPERAEIEAETERIIQKPKEFLDGGIEQYLPVLDLDNLAPGDIGQPGRIYVLQVVDETNMICKFNQTTYWISGVSTRGFTDQETYRLADVLVVAGTRQYQTAIGGSKTVVVLKPVIDLPE